MALQLAGMSNQTLWRGNASTDDEKVAKAGTAQKKRPTNGRGDKPGSRSLFAAWTYTGLDTAVMA